MLKEDIWKPLNEVENKYVRRIVVIMLGIPVFIILTIFFFCCGIKSFKDLWIDGNW